MKPSLPMTPKERRERDAGLLAAYVRMIKQYKAQWGLSPDKWVHLSTWAAVRRTMTTTH